MRRWLVLAAFATSLLLTAGGVRGATSVPIPGTPIQVVELGPNSVVTTFGAATNLTWAVINTGSSIVPYRLNVTASVSDPTLQVNVFPGNVTVPRDTLREVQLNITVPRSGSPRTVNINVTFRTLSPVVSSVQVNASLIIRSEPATIDVLTAF